MNRSLRTYLVPCLAFAIACNPSSKPDDAKPSATTASSQVVAAPTSPSAVPSVSANAVSVSSALATVAIAATAASAKVGAAATTVGSKAKASPTAGAASAKSAGCPSGQILAAGECAVLCDPDKPKCPGSKKCEFAQFRNETGQMQGSTICQ